MNRNKINEKDNFMLVSDYLDDSESVSSLEDGECASLTEEDVKEFDFSKDIFSVERDNCQGDLKLRMERNKVKDITVDYISKISDTRTINEKHYEDCEEDNVSIDAKNILAELKKKHERLSNLNKIKGLGENEVTETGRRSITSDIHYKERHGNNFDKDEDESNVKEKYNGKHKEKQVRLKENIIDKEMININQVRFISYDSDDMNSNERTFLKNNEKTSVILNEERIDFIKSRLHNKVKIKKIESIVDHESKDNFKNGKLFEGNTLKSDIINLEKGVITKFEITEQNKDSKRENEIKITTVANEKNNCNFKKIDEKPNEKSKSFISNIRSGDTSKKVSVEIFKDNDIGFLKEKSTVKSKESPNVKNMLNFKNRWEEMSEHKQIEDNDLIKEDVSEIKLGGKVSDIKAYSDSKSNNYFEKIKEKQNFDNNKSSWYKRQDREEDSLKRNKYQRHTLIEENIVEQSIQNDEKCDSRQNIVEIRKQKDKNRQSKSGIAEIKLINEKNGKDIEERNQKQNMNMKSVEVIDASDSNYNLKDNNLKLNKITDLSDTNFNQQQCFLRKINDIAETNVNNSEITNDEESAIKEIFNVRVFDSASKNDKMSSLNDHEVFEKNDTSNNKHKYKNNNDLFKNVSKHQKIEISSNCAKNNECWINKSQEKEFDENKKISEEKILEWRMRYMIQKEKDQGYKEADMKATKHSLHINSLDHVSIQANDGCVEELLEKIETYDINHGILKSSVKKTLQETKQSKQMDDVVNSKSKSNDDIKMMSQNHIDITEIMAEKLSETGEKELRDRLVKAYNERKRKLSESEDKISKPEKCGKIKESHFEEDEERDKNYFESEFERIYHDEYIPRSKFDSLNSVSDDDCIVDIKRVDKVDVVNVKKEVDTTGIYYPAIQGCRLLSNYEFLNKIEEGTYGEVFRARDKHTLEIVALKRLKMENEKYGFPITSLREVNTLMKAQHENIVTVREVVFGHDFDKIYLVMDFVEHDLKSFMKVLSRPLTIAEVKCLMLQLLSAIAHLHDNWIIHRDIKTSNLLLSHNGILKVADFGLAREYGSPLKSYTNLVVTLWYRAPELLLGQKIYSTHIDMWSVGCIFGEMLLHRPMFSGKCESEQIHILFRELGVPTEEVWPGVSELPVMKKIHYKSKEKPRNDKKLASKLSNSGMYVMNKLLTYCPEKRFTAEEAKNHYYFSETPLAIHPSQFPKFPAKSEMIPKKPVPIPKRIFN